jgi:21S rRNA (GM2251-2'-O)-methyltransferase
MNALEGAGFVHLYGIASVLNALAANRRDFVTSVEKTEGIADDRFQKASDPDFYDDDDDDDEDNKDLSQTSVEQAGVKPQAQFRPYLFVQDQKDSGRRGSKASAAQQILELAKERDIPIATVDKGILNTLCGNRPHQGFVLRCGKLFFESLSRIPLPTSSSENTSPSLWLVLDEVVDPQNLGALLRSAYFLGGGTSKSNRPSKVGVLVCSKNSAPPSPVVSASSAGALELLEVHSTTNLPRTLNQAREEGFRIIGASSSIPSSFGGDDDDAMLYDLQNLPAPSADGDNRPVLLVLGSEGHGLRTLVAKACTEFVRIPSSGVDLVEEETTDEDGESEAGVDSLNVSVTGGIMLWHLLHQGRKE